MRRLLLCLVVLMGVCFATPLLGAPDGGAVSAVQPETSVVAPAAPEAPPASAPEPMAAPALSVPSADPETSHPTGTVPTLPVQFSPASWAVYAQLVLAFAIMLLIRLVQMKWKEIPKDWLPWVSAVIGVASSAGLALADGAPFSHLDAMAMLCNGIVAGFAGSGAWSGVGKHVLPTKK